MFSPLFFFFEHSRSLNTKNLFFFLPLIFGHQHLTPLISLYADPRLKKKRKVRFFFFCCFPFQGYASTYFLIIIVHFCVLLSLAPLFFSATNKRFSIARKDDHEYTLPSSDRIEKQTNRQTNEELSYSAVFSFFCINTSIHTLKGPEKKKKRTRVSLVVCLT